MVTSPYVFRASAAEQMMSTLPEEWRTKAGRARKKGGGGGVFHAKKRTGPPIQSPPAKKKQQVRTVGNFRGF